MSGEKIIIKQNNIKRTVHLENHVSAKILYNNNQPVVCAVFSCSSWCTQSWWPRIDASCSSCCSDLPTTKKRNCMFRNKGVISSERAVIITRSAAAWRQLNFRVAKKVFPNPAVSFFSAQVSLITGLSFI